MKGFKPLNHADAAALAAMLEVRPRWVKVARAFEVIPFPGRALLHAGPPVACASELAVAVRHSALLAILYEGWADTREKAEALLDAGTLGLYPAQDFCAAIPLADVLSPGMAVIVVEDALQPSRRAFSTLNGGDGPVARVGVFDDAVLERLQWVNRELASHLSEWIEHQPLELLPIADQALAAGDDCHGMTRHASALLAAKWLGQGSALPLPEPVRSFLESSAAFFLNPWMAAVKCILQAAQGFEGSGVVTAIGGNGRQFGIQVAAWPGRWFTAPATPPLIPAASEALFKRSLGAIGDSAIVDAFGLGAMAARYSPVTSQRLEQVCQEHGLQPPESLLTHVHPAFTESAPLRTGLSAFAVCERGQSPVISLGVLDREGLQGRLDGGFYFCARVPFETAVAQLEALHETA
ncbi:DUF1116 domain-containing protein [Pseudomonas sp.]|uniref:oxamate carbamoyltransferase subunit AllG family protein n=1 Tax=Pseudomonas sp. TaxID=306 RepID=UPI00260F7B04|nr:DUF1116 domain-containing protein [Pseudomonas sp.]